MMPGIKEGQAKMSKSDPDSAIFMEDTEKDVERKIGKSFCPPNSVQDNPCVAYVRHMILPKLGEIVITLEGDAGTRTYRESEIDKFEEDYMNGLIFPGVLKKVLVVALNKILQPVRDHFATGEAKELLEKVKVLRQSK
jgi:tyrosyl-tRNA synthetase